MTPQLSTQDQHEECPRRLVACQYCELEVCASELQKHTDYCGARTDRCKGCTKYVQARHLQFHYNSDHKYLTPEDKDRGNNGADSGDEGSDECPICLGPITLPLALECGHVFCMVCVKGIANTTKNCAICRRDIPRDMLMDIRFCREEDVIKNYVNKPRDSKKSFRSHSVPVRVQPASAVRRVTTTQDYDDMVSHLLSNRTTSSTPYRYQRPNNTHTPAHYTPYSYTNNTPTHTTNTNTTNSNTNDDDCCCSSSASSNANSAATAMVNSPPNTSSQSSVAPPHPSSVTSSTAISTTRNSRATPPQSSTVSTSSSADSKPKRPTSLALSSSLNESTTAESNAQRGRPGPPPNATQEQYDRWLAFQLAQAEDDVSAAEFNKKHRPAIGRSQSMPERAVVSVAHRDAATSSDSSDSSDDDENAPARCTSSRPPASPRTTSSSQPSGNSTGSTYSSSYSSSSSLSTSSRSPSLSKSSSDSSASGPSTSGSRTISTGARPKSSALKKRVSFKEEAPEERRVAPIMLPCEFCDEMFPERDLMRHQTSCDLNETQMPRVRRDSITSPPLLNSPTRNLNSPIISNRNFVSTSAPNSNLGSPVSPTSRRKTPPNLPFASHTKRTDVAKSSSSDNHRTPPTSPPPRPPHAPYSSHHNSSVTSNINRIRSSPQPNSNELTDSSSDSRPTSVSPCPPHSNHSYSSGISSMASSTRSVSSTPSSSSSASPIPAVVDTPTDIEADFEDDDTPFTKPRRGKLLSSAIGSWRNISGRDRPRYTRSNTAPLEDTGEDSPEPNPVINSMSASQLPPLPPRPESTPAEPEQSLTQTQKSDNQQPSSQQKQKSQQVFIKRQKKYRAPAPPMQQIIHATLNSETENMETTCSTQSHTKKQDHSVGTFFRLDSKPMMNTETQNISNISETCEFCKLAFPFEKIHAHKSTCDMAPNNKMQPFLVSKTRPASPASDSPSTSPTDQQISDAGTSPTPSSQLRRYERAQSVLDERCFPTNRGGRLERANSIKEGSRGRTFDAPSMGRRWSSRETLFCQRGESPSTLSAGATHSGGSIAGGKYSSRGWSDHVSMVQDDVKAKLTSAKALLYERERESEKSERDINRPSFIADLRTWLDKTNTSSNLPSMGSSRYRSSSVARPSSSLYASSGYGSTTRLTSLDYRSPYDAASPRGPFNITDSFGSAFRRRYVR